MRLKLLPSTDLRQLNSEFRRIYPNLKLLLDQAVAEMDEELPLSAVYPHVKGGVIQVDPLRTVDDVIHQFRAHRLPVQIYRRAGDLWVSTNDTQRNTLAEQNSLGAATFRMRFNAHTLFL